MMTIISSVLYPSKTVPGRSQSAYLSTPITDPTPSKVIKVLQDHFNSLQHHIKYSDLENLKINVSIQ